MSRHLLFTAAVALLVSLGHAQSPNLNRLVSTGEDPATGIGHLYFTDADTLAVQAFPLPGWFFPSAWVAMDRNGDVWLSQWNTSTSFLRFSGVDGTVQATLQHPWVVTDVTTTRQGSLVIASYGPPNAGANQRAFLHEYDAGGNLLRQLDLTTLFPPGSMTGSPLGNPFAAAGGVRIVVEQDGSCWVTLGGSTHYGLLKLNPTWTLNAAYGIYLIYRIVPDRAGGVWVIHGSNLALGQPSPVMPGIGNGGWVHLDAQGVVVEANPFLNFWSWGSGRMRTDGRHYEAGPAAYMNYIHARLPGTLGNPFPIANAITLPPTVDNLFGRFELDGNQRVWTLRTGQLASSRWTWHRSALEAPYPGPREVGVEVGRPYGLAQGGNPYLSSIAGESSLYRYARVTDPTGDLDGDGVSNIDELNAFSNPFVANGWSTRPSMSVSSNGQGAWLDVTWTVPNDQGLPYAAPFALGAQTTALVGGHFVPVALTDPLVQWSLGGGAGLQNVVGVLDSSGMATASAFIPVSPQISGQPVTTCIATVDPITLAFVETVSPAFTITLP